LLEDRLIQVELFAQPGDGFRVGALSHHVLNGIARRDIEQQEHHDHDADQRRDRKRQPANDEREQL
jgi:hypothetical protein